MSDAFNTDGDWTAGFTYDILGNVLTATDANNVTITNTYDRANRVKTRTYTGEPQGQPATPGVNFYYDGKGLDAVQTPQNFGKGKLTKVENTVSQTLYKKFDNFGRLEEMEQTTPVGETIAAARAGNRTYISKYTYNLSGALVEEEYPSGRKVRNEFESDGDLLNVASKKSGGSVFTPYVSNFSYTASGGISQMKLGNGKWETAKFNTRLQVTELGLGASATDAGLWKVNYEYGELDANGNVVTSKNTGNIAKQVLTIPGTSFVQAYKFDSLYRLTEAKETTGANQNWIQNWTFDRYGNRTSMSQNVAGTVMNSTPTIDANANRFVLTGTNFQYDLNGNLIRDAEGRQFTFNGDNKQTVVRDAANNPIGQYFYDGEGKRIKKVTNSETMVFVYSSGKLIAEYSTQLSQNPTISYTTTDHLGSPRIITDQFGQIKSRRDFMPFGEDLFNGVGARTESLKYGSSTDDIKQKFTGYLKDSETGLDFAEARMYENRHGRFTAVDPLMASGKSANPQTFNRFVYVGNNPLDRVDPDGEDWYRARHVRVTYGKTRVTYQPYWSSRTLGAPKWNRGSIYRAGYGADAGKWIALDPYSANSKIVGTRAEAIAARNAYRKQAVDDVIGAAVHALADTADSVSAIGVTRPLADAAMNAVGITPNESSQVYVTTNRGANTLIAVGSVVGVEAAAVRAGSAATRPKSVADITKVSTLEPGPFATQSIPARGNAPLTTAERGQIDAIGRTSGCHTCGTTNPGTPNGRFIGDHQPPSALATPTEVYPHCLRCSTSQGGIVRGVREGRFPNPYHDR